MLVHQCRLTFSHSPTKKSPYAVKCWTTSIYKIPTTKICGWGSFCGKLPKGLLRYISDVGMRCRHAMQVWNVGTISKRVTVNIKFNQAKWWSSFICIPTYLMCTINLLILHCFIVLAKTSFSLMTFSHEKTNFVWTLLYSELMKLFVCTK